MQEGGEPAYMIPSTADCPSVILSANVILRTAVKASESSERSPERVIWRRTGTWLEGGRLASGFESGRRPITYHT